MRAAFFAGFLAAALALAGCHALPPPAISEGCTHHWRPVPLVYAPGTPEVLDRYRRGEIIFIDRAPAPERPRRGHICDFCGLEHVPPDRWP